MNALSTTIHSDRIAGSNHNRKVTSPHLCWAEIDLDAVADNVRTIRSVLSANVELLAVVKANAYGLGAVPVSRVVLAAGATRLGVANLDEAAELRQAGIAAPILVLGYIPDSEAERVLDLRVVPTVASAGLADALDRTCRRRRTQIPVHIKVDTGMGRFGLLPGEVEPLLRSFGSSGNLRFEGIFSHFATADSPDKSSALRQLKQFNALLNTLKASGFEFACVHLANSAATLALPQAHFDMVRCGLALIGHSPGESSTRVRRSGRRSLSSPAWRAFAICLRDPASDMDMPSLPPGRLISRWRRSAMPKAYGGQSPTGDASSLEAGGPRWSGVCRWATSPWMLRALAPRWMMRLS